MYRAIRLAAFAIVTGCAPAAAAPSAPLVCVDPGHPSEASAGGTGNGLSERRINWLVAVRLKLLLEQRGLRCILTKRAERQFVTNRRRAEIANRAHAALFVRLHCDTAAGRGFTWYYPDREATIRGVTGPPPAVRAASAEAARALSDEMAGLLAGRLPANPVKTDAATFIGRRQGGVLTGSVFARVPTVLIEMCNLRSREDARFIARPDGQQLLAQALATAIADYVRSHPAP